MKQPTWAAGIGRRMLQASPGLACGVALFRHALPAQTSQQVLQPIADTGCHPGAYR